MPDDSANLRVLADFAMDAVQFELLAPKQVVVWADALIAACDTLPASWLIDLSLVDQSDPLAVCKALREVPGVPIPKESFGLLSGLVLREWRDGHLSIGSVRGIGWQLHQRGSERRDLSKWGAAVECEGDELDDERISLSRMREVIDNELGRFESYIPRLPKWA